jgi:hypothetical protein
MLPSPASPNGNLHPAHRDIGFSLGAMAAQAGLGLAECDHNLLRHLAGRLDIPLLAALRREFGSGGPLDAGIGPPTHVALALTTVLSDSFAAAIAGMKLGIEIALLDAAADPAGFAEAHQRLAASGIILILGGLMPLTLRLFDPGTLPADRLKLVWSDTASAWLDDIIARIGPARFILDGADCEAALRWGLARGIRRFQGRHVDAMLAASRLASCAHGQGCTLAQCGQRAASANPAARQACGNLALLDGLIS